MNTRASMRPTPVHTAHDALVLVGRRHNRATADSSEKAFGSGGVRSDTTGGTP